MEDNIVSTKKSQQSEELTESNLVEIVSHLEKM